MASRARSHRKLVTNYSNYDTLSFIRIMKMLRQNLTTQWHKKYYSNVKPSNEELYEKGNLRFGFHLTNSYEGV